jgi:Uma2 family endonuclease
VLVLEQAVEVYRRPEAGEYKEKHRFELTETIECSSLPGVRIHIADLFG